VAADQRQSVQQRRQQLVATKAELQQQGAEEEPRKVWVFVDWIGPVGWDALSRHSTRTARI